MSMTNDEEHALARKMAGEVGLVLTSWTSIQQATRTCSHLVGRLPEGSLLSQDERLHLCFMLNRIREDSERFGFPGRVGFPDSHYILDRMELRGYSRDFTAGLIYDAANKKYMGLGQIVDRASSPDGIAV